MQRSNCLWWFLWEASSRSGLWQQTLCCYEYEWAVWLSLQDDIKQWYVESSFCEEFACINKKERVLQSIVPALENGVFKDFTKFILYEKAGSKLTYALEIPWQEEITGSPPLLLLCDYLVVMCVEWNMRDTLLSMNLIDSSSSDFNLMFILFLPCFCSSGNRKATLSSSKVQQLLTYCEMPQTTKSLV